MTDWFLSRGAPTPWSARVFCFPHAGGNPRTFLDWQPTLGDEAEIVAVCAPGRAHRAGEPVPTMDELIAGATSAIRAELDERPSYLFGHSMGALVAFEVARRMRDVPTLWHLVASGVSAPSLLPSQRVRELARMHGREFAEAVAFFGGLPPELVAEEDVRDLLLPTVMADFRMAAGYRYRPAPPLAIGVTLINGRDDPHVGPPQLAPWDRECATPPVRRWADGGHFYFEPDPSAAVELLLDVIRADQHVEVI
jgi:surfactin synthase thioesterase subunit